MSRIPSNTTLPSAPLYLVNTGVFTGQGNNNHNASGSSSTPTSTAASSSSPYAMTPSSNPDHSHPYSSSAHSNARHSPLLLNALHPPPSMPSTFLPSYYPESRFPSDSLPSLLVAGSARDGSEEGGNHTPSAWERASRTGPSSFDLLEGVQLPSPYIDAKYNGSGSGLIGNGSGDSGSGSGRNLQIETSTNQRSLAGNPPLSLSPVSSTGQTQWQNTDRSGYGNGNLASRHPSTGPQAVTHVRSSPLLAHGPVSEPPRNSGSSRVIGGGENSNHHQSLPSFMLPPPQPSLSQLATMPNAHPQANTIRPSASYVDGDTGPLPEFVESSSVYPPGMYGTHLLMDTVSLPGEGADSRLEPSDMSHIYTIYSDLLQGIAHIVPNNQAAPIPTSSSGPTFTSLLSLATEGTNLLKGQKEHNGNSEKKNVTSARSLAHRLPSTKCLGCGATETPEWRRGPLGPRTLCNACGLVHIKLQRKKKKQEEKARAAAAAAAGEEKPNIEASSSRDRKG